MWDLFTTWWEDLSRKRNTFPPSTTQAHLGLQNKFKDFQANIVCLEPKPGKLEDIHSELIDIRFRQDQMVSLGENMVLAGKLIFLLMSCLNQMARGGLQPFLQWLANNSAYGSPTCNGWQTSTTVHSKQSSFASRFKIDSSLAMRMECSYEEYLC